MQQQDVFAATDIGRRLHMGNQEHAGGGRRHLGDPSYRKPGREAPAKSGRQQLIARLQQPPHTVVISGVGEFLALQVLEELKLKSAVISLTRELGPELSRCAAAHALAVLAHEGSK